MFYSKLLSHETKRQTLLKFLSILGILFLYFLFLIYKYGVAEGFSITILTWSFFVLCTPIADAGFLLDFPIRLTTRIRMIHSEMIVWVIAISLNYYFFFFSPGDYQKTWLLRIFHFILEKPFPFWIIIILSAVGTFLSIYFGDELMDVVRHKERVKHREHQVKHRFIIFAFLMILTIIVYKYLLSQLGIEIPL